MSYQPGEIVDITIKGARVGHEGDGFLNVFVNGKPHTVDFDDAVTIVRRAPEVRGGDLWRDDPGCLWFAVEDDNGSVVLTCNGRNRRPAAEIHDLYGPLTLVHREDEQDDGEVSAP